MVGLAGGIKLPRDVLILRQVGSDDSAAPELTAMHGIAGTHGG